jgi:predicted enzyme related to lactoylglutathione lyase
MPHPVIWFEVIGKDSDALSKFYGDLFDWKIDPGPQGYYMATPEGERPSGGIGADPSGGDGFVTFYAETDDLQAMWTRPSGSAARRSCRPPSRWRAPPSPSSPTPRATSSGW